MAWSPRTTLHTWWRSAATDHQIGLPMYERLKHISSELFAPNIQLVESNSITPLEMNQKFIESFTVGLNHEFEPELTRTEQGACR